MMLRILFPLLVFPIFSFSQLGVQWNGEQSVSDGSIYGRQRPRMAVTSNNIPVIVYGKSNGLFVSRWNGVSFDAPVSILPAGMQTYIADWTGPDIAAKGDTVIVVFKAMPLETGNVYSVRSTDGGNTFSDTIRVDNHDNAVAWMPSLDITQDGNPVVSYMIHDANWSNPRYVLARSIDAGLTYTSEIDIVTGIPGEACDCCPSEMVVSGLKEVLLFRNNESNVRNIHGVYSNDGGVTYPFQEDIDLSNWYVNSCPATAPHGTFIDNQLIAVYTTGASGNYRVSLSVSELSAGFSHDSTYQFNDPTLNRNFPRISSSNDTVVMVWREYIGPQSDIYLSVSTNGNYADLLTNAFQAGMDPSGVQTNPDIIFKNGWVHLCYQDNYSGDVKYRSGTIGDVASLGEVENTLEIWPNPSVNGEFFINTTTTEISIINSVGQSVAYNLSVKNGQTTIQLSEPSNGLYYLLLRSSDELVVKKLVNY